MDFQKKLETTIERLEAERAQILHAICEDDQIYLPEVILQLVQRIRSLTKTLRAFRELLKNEDNEI